MIRTKTVFVLGAGASMPYGFPSGAGLRRELVDDLARPDSYLTLKLIANGVSRGRLLEFTEALLGSGRESVDAFLYSRPEFLEVGKMAIVLAIARREDETKLVHANRKRDWLSYLFNRMVGGSLPDLKSNNLKVITFNFDRSFQRRLFLVAKYNYDLNDIQASQVCSRYIEVVHMHGDLGMAWWSGGYEGARPYGPLSEEESNSKVAKFAERIRLVYEPDRVTGMPDPRVELAQTWLYEAERVVFIGFGYLDLNLKRLNVKALLTGRPMSVCGTVFGMEDGEIGAVQKAFDGAITCFPCDALSLLRRTSFVHDE